MLKGESGFYHAKPSLLHDLDGMAIDDHMLCGGRKGRGMRPECLSRTVIIRVTQKDGNLP